MSIIVFARDNNKIVVGSDSQLSCGDHRSFFKHDKLIEQDDFIIGAVGSVAKFQKLIRNLDWRLIESVYDLADAVTYILEKETESDEGWGALLVVHDDRVYEIDDGGSCLEFDGHSGALGSGRDYALGCLHPMYDLDAEYSVRVAIKAACKYSNTCGGEATVITKLLEEPHEKFL